MEKIMYVGNREVVFRFDTNINQFEILLDGSEQIGFADQEDYMEAYYAIANLIIKGRL